MISRVVHVARRDVDDLQRRVLSRMRRTSRVLVHRRPEMSGTGPIAVEAAQLDLPEREGLEGVARSRR